jgi:DNA mismatch repair protein MLH3
MARPTTKLGRPVFLAPVRPRVAWPRVSERLLHTAIRRSPRKMERKPVYVLNLTLPPCHMDNCLEPAKASMHLKVNITFPKSAALTYIRYKNRDVVTSLLSSVVQAFLLRHGFVTSEVKDRKRIRREDTPPPSPSPSPSPPPQPSPSKSRRRRQPSHDHSKLTDRFAPDSMAIDEPDTTADQASLYAYHVRFTVIHGEWSSITYPFTGHF